MIKSIPLNQLCISEKNARTLSPKKKADKELMASILEFGVLNNLVVIHGSKKKLEVVAGGRRFAALQALADNGEIEKDYLVDCRVKESDEATAVSLIENMHREPMHPADEFMAYDTLAQDGRSVDEIARAFGQSKNHVKRMMRLGNVHPKLVELYRKGKLDLDGVMAFAITEDQERQWACYESLKSGYFGAYQIRQFLTDNTVTSDDPMARYVGYQAYKKAGGYVGDHTYWVDVTLLRRLAQDKLEQEKQACEAEGWAWVEISEAPWQQRQKCREISAPFIDVPDTISQQIEEQEKALALLHDLDYDDKSDADFERESALEDSLEALEEEKERYRAFSDDQKAIAGCVVGLDGEGRPVVLRGLVRPQDKARAAEVLSEAPASEEENGDLFVSEPDESHALQQDLKAYYRQAFQAHLLSQETLCQDMMIFTLACGVFRVRDFGQTLLDMTVTLPAETALDIDQTDAAEKLNQAKDKLDLAWLEGETQAQRFEGFMALSQVAKKRIMAHCVARVAHSPFQGCERSAWPALVSGSGFNLADHWTPTETTYFSRVKRDVLLKIGGEVCGADWREQHQKQKKGVLASLLPTLDEMRHWIPAFLQ